MRRHPIWHGPRRAVPRRRQNLPLIVACAILLAINIAVVLYHGDPRRLLARQPTTTPAAHGHTLGRAPRNQQLSWGAFALGRIVRSLCSPQQWFIARAHAHEGPIEPIHPLADLRAPGLVQRLERVQLTDGRPPARALQAVGTRPDDIHAVVTALGHEVDLRRLRPSDTLTARYDATGRLLSLSLSRGPLEQINVTRQDGRFVAERQAIGVDTVVAEVTGEVQTSLWDTLIGAGEDPRLVQSLVDIFAYEVDFYSEVRQGDSFRLLIEKRYARGQFIGYGDVLAAELNSGGQLHRAYLYRHNEQSEYYNELGAAMRKQLLRMPLQYGAVTSRFGRRKHPILGYTRAHNGTDYGVPIGTPVLSVGDGTVVRAGWHGGYGRLVEVRHGNGWLSQYAHLSKINVHIGQHVHQKQVVGLVGMTGLATGPHLHYGLKKNGHYVNSLAQHFERAHALSGSQLDSFNDQVRLLNEELGKMQVAQQPLKVPAAPGVASQHPG